MKKQINIEAPWEVNDYLKQVIEEKMEKLFIIQDRIIHADIFLKKGANSGVEDKLIEVRLRTPGPEIFAQAYADTYEKAVAAVTEKLRRQLVKKKEKLSNNR